MAKDSLFGGLPPPASSQSVSTPSRPTPADSAPARSSILASASVAKRSAGDSGNQGKRVRFKTTTEAEVVDAMVKIATHIGNAAKFCKASKLALQLLEAGSVTPDNADAFFRILKAAMASPPSHATDSALRGDYQALFSAVHERLECFSGAQRAQIEVWELWALVGNDLHTDDSFVFSKAASRLRQAIDSLPEAPSEGDLPEARGDTSITASEEQSSTDKGISDGRGGADVETVGRIVQEDAEESDPFGLSALLPKISKKEERARRKLEEEAASRKAEEDAGKLLRERREALLECLKLASGHYKMQWAQTVIDILVKHAFDNVAKFTAAQRAAIVNLWASIREQQIRRKQGKSTSGKLDVTAFERLQNQFSRQTMSIRRAVGSGGDRSAEQWLG